MAIPNEKLQQLLQEISSKAAFAEQQLTIVRAQIATKKRESRVLELTSKELASLSRDTPVYDGVGKMFVRTSIEEVEKRQQHDAEEVKKELAGLDKKLNYLETTYRNSREHLEGILGRGG